MFSAQNNEAQPRFNTLFPHAHDPVGLLRLFTQYRDYFADVDNDGFPLDMRHPAYK